MKPKDMLFDDFASVLEYSPDTGEFKWKSELKDDKNKRGGMSAGYINKGYLCITANRKLYTAARVAWLLTHKEITPDMQIDHINRNGLDNRLCNLRLVTSSENCNNRRNRYGEKEPRHYTLHSGGKFQVCVKGNYLGLVETEDEAKRTVALALKVMP